MLALLATAQRRIDDERNALYAREASSDAPTRDEWMALGERQIAVTAAIDVTGAHPFLSPWERIDREVAPRYQEHVRMLVAYVLA